MATERQAPDVLLASSGLTGGLSDIDDDPDSPDANWMVATGNNVNTVARTSFPAPTGDPTVGADLQEFKAQVRQYDGGQTGTPEARLELWENGGLIRAGSDVDVTSDTGQLITLDWNANELATADGSLVECKFVGTKTGGSPSTRNTVDLGAVEWNVTYDEVVTAWLAGYSFRKKIPITGQGGAGTDYQVKLKVHSGSGSDSNGVVYLASHCQNFPNDIRLTDDDGVTKLDHWLEEFDIENNEATFWVEIADDLGGNQDFYIYYGKNSGLPDSDGGATFPFFDSFEGASLDTNKWDVKQGAVSVISSVTDGAFMEHTSPVAQYYEGTYKRTYFVYMTMSKKIQIRYYDHDADVISSPATLWTASSQNDHDAPSILVLSNGKILVFFSEHNGLLSVRRSTNAEDISSWENAVTIESDDTSYSQPILLSGGDVWIFYRYEISATHRTWCYKVSGDDGDTWGSRTTLVDFGDGYYIYGRVARGGNTIHVAWTRRVAPAGVRDNIYYIYSPDNGTTWRKRDGTSKTPPIDAGEADLVYDTGAGEESQVADIKLDGSNDPYIVFADDSASDPSDARFAFYDGGWETHFICNLKQVAAAPARPAYICIDDADVYKVYAGVPDAGKSEIQEWTSGDDGDTWAFSQSITDASEKDHWRPCCVKNYQSSFKLLWQTIRYYTGYTDFGSYLTSYPSGPTGSLELIGTTGTRGLIQGKTAFSYPRALQVSARATLALMHNTHFCTSRKVDSWTDKIDLFAEDSSQEVYFQTRKDNITESTPNISVSDITEAHRYWWAWKSGEAKVYQDDVLKATHNTQVPTIDQRAVFYEADVVKKTWTVDYIFVRKYNDPEPIVGTAGSEEAAPVWLRLIYTSEPPTPNAWNQLKREAGSGGYKKLLFEGE